MRKTLACTKKHCFKGFEQRNISKLHVPVIFTTVASLIATKNATVTQPILTPLSNHLPKVGEQAGENRGEWNMGQAPFMSIHYQTDY